jgi:membrane-associated phospholipid phosphatase
MLFVTHWHQQAGILLMTLLLALHLRARRASYWLLALMLAVPGGMLLNVLLKYTFQRARPRFDEPLLTLASYSFPSGHTSGAMLFYGLLAAYLVCTLPR